MSRSRLLVALLPLVLVAGRLSAQLKANIPATPFVRPGGPYAIGTYDSLWVDSKRPEPYTRNPDDRRKLPIQILYPAAPGGSGAPASYIVAPDEFGEKSPYKPVEHVKTNAVTGAPVAEGGKFPVLIYNHGAGWSRFTGTFVTEVLASQGYVIVAIDHPGVDRTQKFSDGTAWAPDTLQMPTPDPKDLKASSARAMAFLNSMAFPMWVEDSKFVLDRVEALNKAPGPFKGRLDLDRVGMLGWSFGGATAIEMLRADKRVKASVNHDGRLFGSVMTEPVGRPFMLMHHGIDDAATAPEANRATMREMMDNVKKMDSDALARATDDWYDLTIARTNHGHFSDLPIFMSSFADTTLLAGPRAHEIIVRYTLAFFDRYLKGKKDPILEPPSAEYPEVTFKKR